MAKFGEDIKNLLLDVERFLMVSLKNVTLPASTVEKRTKLIADIDHLREEWPQLQPDIDDKRQLERDSEPSADTDKSSSMKREGSSGNLLDDSKVPDVGVADLTDPVKVGFLVKKSKEKSVKDIFKRKRYYVLHGAILYSFDKNTSKKPNWSRPVEHHDAKEVRDTTTKKEFQFEFNCPGMKTLVFATTTEEEMKEWIVAINKEAGVEMAEDENYYEGDALNKDTIDDDVYEETDDVIANRPRPTPPASTPVAPPKAASEPDDELYDDMASPTQDDELYEDGFTAPVNKTSTQAASVPPASVTPPQQSPRDPQPDDAGSDTSDIYDDAFSPEVGEEEDLYEAYDDIALNLSKPKIEEESPDVPPPRSLPSITPSLPPRNKPHESPQLPPRGSPEGSDSNVMGENYYENLYYGVWECKADTDSELDFSRGDILEVISKKYGNKGWWVAKLNENIGLVPQSFLSPAYKEI